VGFRVVADGIPDALAGARGDAERGRKLIVAREAANCVLCHVIPDPALRVAGTVGPPLDHIGAKFSVAQLRLRVADYVRVNAAATMPSYYRVKDLDQVAGAYRGKPILAAGEVEDIVAYLSTLK
jgi:L-cysteine S-thiosulfotransferase